MDSFLTWPWFLSLDELEYEHEKYNSQLISHQYVSREQHYFSPLIDDFHNSELNLSSTAP